MRVPDPIANTTTEAYLAYKAGYLEESELKPSLYDPYLHFDAWLAYWCELTNTYPTDKNGDPETLTDEEALVAYLAEVTNTYPEENKDPYEPRIASYLRYLISAKYGRPEYPVDNREFYLSTMKPPVVISGDTPSSDIEMDDTAEAEFVDLEMYGDTSQTTYSGKNLMTFKALEDRTDSGVTCSFDGSEIILDGTSTGAKNIVDTEALDVELPAGTYTLSLTELSGSYSLTYQAFALYVYASDGTFLAAVRSDYDFADGNFTLNATSGLKFRIYINNSGVVFDNWGIGLQIEAGETSSSYEPYVGGTASPNPAYPQAVNTVTGVQTITVKNGDDTESEEYGINLGDIELCKVGDYQDYIYRDGNNWYLHQEVRHLSLAVNDMNNVNTYPGWKNISELPNDLGTNINSALSAATSQMNNFISDSSTSPRINTVVSQGDYSLFIRSSDYPYLTQNQWKENYPDLVCEIYYGIINAIADTEIYDNNLISQLDALMKGGSYEGKTYIKVTTTGPNLPAGLIVTAGKDV